MIQATHFYTFQIRNNLNSLIIKDWLVIMKLLKIIITIAKIVFNSISIYLF